MTKQLPTPIAKELRKKLLASGRTQSDLAQLAGMAQSSTRAFMLAESSCSIDNAYRLAKAIGMRLTLENQAK